MSLEDATLPATSPDLQTQVLAPLPTIEGYDVLEVLGRGGMGRVYKAKERALGRIVAIKMLIDAGDDMLIARFQAESQAVAGLQHPNIAQVFQIGQVNGQPFLVLEYLSGGSLAQQLAGKPQSPADAAQTVELLARAMEHSHKHGIIHRDLKPANILLAADGTPKITDFGLAKRLQENSGMTRTGEILGTPSYMAPEQASGGTSTAGPAADVYALGAILYEMVTGRPPFQGPDTMQTVMMVLTMEPVSPSRLLPQLPRDLETICLKCLEKLPRKRYESAAALADDLRRFIEGRPIVARPVPWWERTLKWAGRRPWAAGFLGLLFASVLGLLVGIVHIQRTNRDLQNSIHETRASLSVARNAIDRMLVRLSDQLAPVPQSEQIRRESLEDARKLYEQITAIRPDDSEGRSQVADALGKLGKIYSELGRLDDAEATTRKSLALHVELEKQEPSVADHRRGHANMLLNLANLERKRGRLEPAEKAVRSALAEIEPLLKDPIPETLRSASAIHNTLALLLRTQKKTAESENGHKIALKLGKQWLAMEPKSDEAKVAVASRLSNLATFYLVSRPEEAISALAEAEQLLAGQTAPQQRFFLGQFQGNRAVAYEQTKKEKEAEATHALAIATLTALVGDYSSVPDYRHVLARSQMNLARYFAPRGRSEEALRHFRVAGPLLERLAKEYPDNKSFRADRDLCRQFTAWAEEDIAEANKKKAAKKKTP